ncbi:hypothetical protein JCM33374_g5561 [Metschnikowia sp. JCM 33374]|nr:hypothetical protein JCM33374_g5561 [Metschnikowia sp. JCM 33374]
MEDSCRLASGYESDSDDHGVGDDSDDSQDSGSEQEKEPAQQEATKDGNKEDDDDMFASDNEADDTQQEQKPPKDKHLFDNAQFEKEQGLEDYQFQVENSDGLLKTRPDGAQQDVQLEAFNLREEVESGKFDKDMNYIQGVKDDSDDQEEPWMAEVSTSDIQKAKMAQQRSSAGRLNEATPPKPLSEVLSQLISLLEPAETPMEALGRLRPQKRKRNKRVEKTPDTQPNNEDDSHRKETVFLITECCEMLVNEKGIASAYDMSREELMRAFSQETGETFQAKGTKRNADEMEAGASEYGEAIWEFRWVGETNTNGPYSEYEMKYWKDTYFDNNVEVRKLDEPEFVHVSRVSFQDSVV